MGRFPGARNIHQAFMTGLLLKAAFALAESIGGIVLYFTKQQFWLRLVRSVTGHELIEDPHDLLANYLQHAAQQLSGSALHFAAGYLLGHGIVKLWLIAGLLRKRLWYYPVAIVVFGMFVVYQLYRFRFTHSIFLLLITVLDLVVMALTWYEFRHLRRGEPEHFSPDGSCARRTLHSRHPANRSTKWFVLAAAVFGGGTWLFFGVLEDVVSRDPLVGVDVLVYQLLQDARTPMTDNVMVAITELGDVQVLLPVIAVVLVWFVVRRLWSSAAYWLIAVGVAELLTKILKLVLRRPRPGAFYPGIEEFSFPSGHATMSVVVYGFLAFLLCRHQCAGQRMRVAIAATTLVTLIAISRLYLGAHWLSDVVGGMAFGAAWIALLAIAYAYQSTEDIRPKPLMALIAAVLCVAGGIHVALHHANDVAFYAGAVAGLR